MSSSETAAGDVAKSAAAQAALELVTDGMVLGLGTGRTAALFVRGLAERMQQGLAVSGVPTSVATADLAKELGIPLVELPAGGVDLAVDGADEVDPDWTLVKGGGGAHVRERIVAGSAKQFVVVVDETKVVSALSGSVPVAILPFGQEHTLEALAELGSACEWRKRDGSIVRDSDGNLIADVRFTSLREPTVCSAQLDAVPGVVGHGLFVDYASQVIVGDQEGRTRRLERT